ncbi:MAG: patatin-like phospholipase family protein [Patescibacteria group bacterium]
MKDPAEFFGKIGIVASGGGFRGVAVLGFLIPLLHLLARYKLMVRYYGAVSVSAFMLARSSEAHKPEDYEPLLDYMTASWKAVEKKGPASVFDFSYKKLHFWNSGSILDNDPLVELAKHFDPVKSVNSPARLDLFVFDSDTKEHTAISNRDPSVIANPSLLKDAVVASASLVPIFSETKVGARFYYDGGFISLRGAVEAGCDTIFVLFPYPQRYRNPPTKNDFLNKHFPWLEKAASVSAATLRDRDAFEVKYWQDIFEREERITALNSELNERLSDPQVKGLLKQFIGKLPILGRFLEKPRGAEKKIPCIIPLYENHSPETLLLKDFNAINRDITVALERATRQMEEELEKMLQ